MIGLRLYIIPVIGHWIGPKDSRVRLFPYFPTGYCSENTILGWKSVPAMRVAMAIRSLWPWKTFTWRARETSGRFTVRPLRMRAAVGSSAVTEGSWGRSWRG